MDDLSNLVGALANVDPTVAGVSPAEATVSNLPIPTSIEEVTATLHKLSDLWTEFAADLERDASSHTGPLAVMLAATSAGAVGVLRSVVIPTLGNLAASIDRRLDEEAESAAAAWHEPTLDDALVEAESGFTHTVPPYDPAAPSLVIEDVEPLDEWAERTGYAGLHREQGLDS